MKNRKPPIALLYAAPNVLRPDPEGADEPERNDSAPSECVGASERSEAAEPEYPANYAEPEYPDNFRMPEPRTGRVYAAPEKPLPKVSAVYAAPGSKPGKGLFSGLKNKLRGGDSRIEGVYAGPELMGCIREADEAPDEPDITSDRPGPVMDEGAPAGTDGGPRAPFNDANIMAVYAGPEWFAHRSGENKPVAAEMLDVYAGPAFFNSKNGSSSVSEPAEDAHTDEPEDGSPIDMKDAMEAASQFPPGSCGLVMAPLDITFGNSILRKPESADGNKKFCPECGSEVDPEHKFCTECGHKLK